MKKRSTLTNIDKLFNGINNVIKFVGDYSSMVLKSNKKQPKINDSKLLTSKEMVQKLPIDLVQVKAGNISAPEIK